MINSKLNANLAQMVVKQLPGQKIKEFASASHHISAFRPEKFELLRSVCLYEEQCLEMSKEVAEVCQFKGFPSFQHLLDVIPDIRRLEAYFPAKPFLTTYLSLLWEQLKKFPAEDLRQGCEALLSIDGPEVLCVMCNTRWMKFQDGMPEMICSIVLNKDWKSPEAWRELRMQLTDFPDHLQEKLSQRILEAGVRLNSVPLWKMMLPVNRKAELECMKNSLERAEAYKSMDIIDCVLNECEPPQNDDENDLRKRAADVLLRLCDSSPKLIRCIELLKSDFVHSRPGIFDFDELVNAARNIGKFDVDVLHALQGCYLFYGGFASNVFDYLLEGAEAMKLPDLLVSTLEESESPPVEYWNSILGRLIDLSVEWGSVPVIKIVAKNFYLTSDSQQAPMTHKLIDAAEKLRSREALKAIKEEITRYVDSDDDCVFHLNDASTRLRYPVDSNNSLTSGGIR